MTSKLFTCTLLIVFPLFLACGGLLSAEPPPPPPQHQVIAMPETPTQVPEKAPPEDPPKEEPVILLPSPETPEQALAVHLVETWMEGSDTGEEERTFIQSEIDALVKATTHRIREHKLVAHEEMLTDIAGANTIEWAIDRVVRDLKSKPALRIEVTETPWRILLVYSNVYATSEDWAYYSDEVLSAAKEKGIKGGSLQMGQHVIVIVRGGEDIATLALPEGERGYGHVGYLFAKEGATLELSEHDMSDGVLGRAGRYFGVSFK